MPPRRAVITRSSAQDQDSGSAIVLDHEGSQEANSAHDELPTQPESRPISPLPEHATTPHPDNATTQLAQAIHLMTSELRRRQEPTRKAKAKEPDTFDGSDPKKLNNFILLCNLYFRSNPAYDDDSAKVTLALSYLRGTALEFFEPSIIDSSDFPIWMDDWSAFVRTLRTQFGPIDPIADAEDGIDNLKMQDNQKIVKYNVEFNRLSIRTGWDENVLRHRYYSGLAERIKDVMGQQGKPQTLDAMKALAHSIDSRHWERLREKSRTGKGKSDTPEKSDKPAKPDDKKHNHASGSNSNNNGNNKGKQKDNNNNSNNNNKGKPAATSGSSTSISDKLGKDGKLTPQERQRRFDNHLCLFCGGPGHSVNNCPKSTSSASKTKARAAQAKEKDSAESSKKD